MAEITDALHLSQCQRVPCCLASQQEIFSQQVKVEPFSQYTEARLHMNQLLPRFLGCLYRVLSMNARYKRPTICACNSIPALLPATVVQKTKGSEITRSLTTKVQLFHFLFCMSLLCEMCLTKRSKSTGPISTVVSSVKRHLSYS